MGATVTDERTSSEFTDRTYAQRRAALDHANEIRSERAQLKRDIKAGRKCIVDVLAEPPDYVLTMKVWDLLITVPKKGRWRVNQMLSRCEVSPSKTVGGMTTRQHRELVELLRRA